MFVVAGLFRTASSFCSCEVGSSEDGDAAGAMAFCRVTPTFSDDDPHAPMMRIYVVVLPFLDESSLLVK